MVLLLEGLDEGIELCNDGLDVFEVVLLEGLELLDCREQFLQFSDAAAEQVELAKDLSRVEVELLGLGHILQSLLCELVLAHVSFVQVQAGLEHLDKLIWGIVIVVPQDGVVNHVGLAAFGCLRWGQTEPDAAEVDDSETAVGNHLVRDLDEETGHTLVGVVVAGDCVDHLDRVHEGGKCVLYALG